MSNIFGDLKSLRASDRAELEKLSQKRTRSEELIDVELAKRTAKIAARLNKQIALLIGRDGRVEQVALGSKDRLYLPDLGRYRLDMARLRRLRVVIFVPSSDDRLTEHSAEPIHALDSRPRRGGNRSEFVDALDFPDDFLTDLEKLRLDALLLIAVGINGLPGPFSLAHLEPKGHDRNASGKLKAPAREQRGIRCYYGRELHDLDLNFGEFIAELETEISRSVTRTFDTKGDKTVLVGAYTDGGSDAAASMEELKELARTAGLNISDVIIQRRKSLDPRTVIGAGKVEQVVLQCLNLGADLLIFDRELSPSQLRSITNLTELRVLDRSMLILDIFAQRARSSEGRLQVELAQLKYSLPRLTERDSGLSRLSGGIGGRGPGETKLEISRRRVRDRIADLEKRIDKVASQRGLRRSRRQERGVPVVAIIGYTNSGKSTLLNALTKGDVLVENKLFATLDPSSRRMRFPNDREVVFVDTVGFIRELPDELVAAFRATLEEVGEADLLVQLVDASNPDFRQQIDVVTQTLSDLGFAEKSRILVFNKIDLLSDFETRALLTNYQALAVSAVQRRGFENLISRIQGELAESFKGQDPGHFLRSKEYLSDQE